MIQRWYFHNHTEALGLKNKSGLIKKTSLDPDKRLLFAKIKHTPDGFLLTQQYRMRLLITQLSEFNSVPFVGMLLTSTLLPFLCAMCSHLPWLS